MSTFVIGRSACTRARIFCTPKLSLKVVLASGHVREPESASMRAPRVGSASPKGEAAERSRHTKGTLAWYPGHR